MYTPQILLIEQHRGIQLSMDFSQCDSGYTESTQIQRTLHPGVWNLKMKSRDNSGKLSNTILHQIIIPDTYAATIPNITLPTNDFDTSNLQLQSTYDHESVTITWNVNPLCYYKVYRDGVFMDESINLGYFTDPFTDSCPPEPPAFIYHGTDPSNNLTTVGWHEAYAYMQHRSYRVEEYWIGTDDFHITSDNVTTYYQPGIKDYWYALSDTLVFDDSTDVAGYILSYSYSSYGPWTKLHEGLVQNQEFITMEFPPGDTLYISISAVDANENYGTVKVVQITMPDDGQIYR